MPPCVFVSRAKKTFPICHASQGKKSILRKPSSQRADPSVRVKFNPLALLLDASLEGEYDLVQRVIYEVSPSAWRRSVAPVAALRFLSHWFWLVLRHFVLTIVQHDATRCTTSQLCKETKLSCLILVSGY